MASCTDLTKVLSTIDYRPLIKDTPAASSTNRKFVEPFNRLRNRANLFRRKNYSSQLDINDPKSLPPAQRTTHHHQQQRPIITSESSSIILKRSNSMICAQPRLPTLLKSKNENSYRSSLCLELSPCPSGESSSDDPQINKPSSNHYWNSRLCSTMSNIVEHEPSTSNESFKETKPDSPMPPKNNSDIGQMSSIHNTSQLTHGLTTSGQNQQMISSVVSSPPAMVTRNYNETIESIRPSHSTVHSIDKRQSTCSSFDEPFYDCKQDLSCIKSSQNFDAFASKISTCTMTGTSLNNLDQCSPTPVSKDKCIQTAHNGVTNISSPMSKNNSSASLSSSSTSIQTDSLENKPKMFNIDEESHHSMYQRLVESYHKCPHIYERLVHEQTCIYWVNYLGSTAIKLSNENSSSVPTRAIHRLRQSTQYARVLPIIGLSISPRGVEFLKHSRDRIVICFHDIKSIHCACQDQDLRYFAYVTHEQRSMNGISYGATAMDHRQSLSSSPSMSPNGDYHDYCHVFVVKSEAMSTEILLTFGQAFDIAYRRHRHLNFTPSCPASPSRSTSHSRFSTKSIKVSSSSTTSPATSSSSSLSNEERRVFI